MSQTEGVEWDWESVARVRLERMVADTIHRVREVADEIEREARVNLAAAERDERRNDWHTYPRVVGRMIDRLSAMTFNLKLGRIIDAAANAEKARTEKEMKRS